MMMMILLLQPQLINNLRDKFGGEGLPKRSYRTPETPRFKAIRPDQDSEFIIDSELQSKYCSGVGILLYLTMYSRPDICNFVRELCKCMDDTNMES
jgi:hypothetical protein